MADFLNVGSEDEWALVVEVMQKVAKAALICCLLWYTGLVVARQLSAPIHPVSDVYWGFELYSTERPV
ncbi:MAG TPA: hypothetical protein VJ746_10960 [Nitrospira sp.]|nr:hypothetical protein [Nitrospira sp.]